MNTQNLLLESVRSARETEPTLPLLMYILKFASRMGAFTFFDGQGLFIVDGVYLAFDLHVDARKLSEDQRMYNAALGFMPGAADTTRRFISTTPSL
ncbi:MAG: hypothetical protein IPK53_10800 [bacterium]|nr:hypothetical protein [bacterium]